MATYAVLREMASEPDGLDESLGFESDEPEVEEEKAVSAHSDEGRRLMLAFGGTIKTVA